MSPGAIVSFYFGWPTGAVWSNLLASLICAGVVWWRLRAKMIAQHVERMEQAERHHQALKDHITATAVPVPPQLLDDIKRAPRKGGDRL